MAGGLDPGFNPTKRPLQFGRGGSAHHPWGTAPVLEPEKFKTKECKGAASFPARMETAEPNNLRLARFRFQPVFAESFRKDLVKSSRIFPVLKGANPIIGIPAHDRPASEVWFDHILEPFIQHGVQVKIG